MKSSKYNNVIKESGKYIHHNTLYGGVIVACEEDNKRISEILKQPDFFCQDANQNAYFMLLAKNNFIIQDDVDEIAICKNVFNKAQRKSATLSITTILTYECNFSCHYCFQRVSRESNGCNSISNSTFINFTKFIRENIQGFSKLRAVWIGGEPLLHLDKILEYSKILIEICEEFNVELVNLVTTNGYLLNHQIIQLLKGLPNCKLQITIDGPPKIHNFNRPLNDGGETFEIILDNIEKCLEEELEVAIRINVDKDNAEYLEELFEYFDKSNISKYKNIVHLARIDHTTTSTEFTTPREYKEFSKIERDIFNSESYRTYLYSPRIGLVSGCPGVGNNDFIIDSKGNVFKCPRYMESEMHAVASFDDKNLRKMNSKYEVWENWNPFSQEKCLKCSLLPLCMGGCPFNAVNYSQDSFCGETKYLYKSRVAIKYQDYLI